MTTALYRRYRPDTFADVIGQEHVTAPLVTALGKDAVSHAYLFSGPRGCGKTTSARILARCLNCAQGPTGNPCGQCDSCRELATGGSGSLDVIEIDAASHGGVDDARDLRERATFAPVRDRYKIFIIDEAHMVTAAGFNALLKIVEEPPEHIKFIFATTEPDKVIGTIRSRTHHYPFRLVPPEPLLDYLERLCASESVAAAPGVLQLVLRAGGGSVRDTLSVLDQLIAGSDADGIAYDRAVALLGFTHAALLDQVIDAAADLDGAKAFEVVDQVVQSGQDPRRFVEDLLERLRDLIVVKSVPENPGAILRGVPEDQIRVMVAQAGRVGPAELSRAADTTAAALTEMVGATSPRLHLELLMARLLLPHAESGHSSLAARLERLERRMDFTSGAGSTPPAEAPAPAAQPESEPAPTPPETAPAPESQPQASPAGADLPDPEAESSAQSGEDPPSSSGDRAPQEPTQQHDDGWAAPGVSWGPPPDPEPSPSAQPEAPHQPQQEAPTSPSAPQQQRPQHSEQPSEPPAAAPTPASAPEQAPPAPSDGGSSSHQMMQRAWPDIVEAMKSRSRMLWMLVKGNVTVGGFDGQTLTLNFANDGARSTFTNRGGKDALAEAIHQVLGMQVSLDLAIGGGAPPKAEGRRPQQPADPQQPTDSAPPADVEPARPSPGGDAPRSPGAPPEGEENWLSDPEDWAGPDTWQPGPEEAQTLQRAAVNNRSAAAEPAVGTAPDQPAPQRSQVPEKPVVPIFARKSKNAPVAVPAPSSDGLDDVDETPPPEPPAPAPHPEEPEDPSAPPPDWAETAPPSPPAAPARSHSSPPAQHQQGPGDSEDVPSEDDVEITHSGVFGRRAIERILGGALIEERRLDEQAH
ncbi:DNA polymerase III subunit gamma and tau [Nesterenkonia populi]